MITRSSTQYSFYDGLQILRLYTLSDVMKLYSLRALNEVEPRAVEYRDHSRKIFIGCGGL